MHRLCRNVKSKSSGHLNTRQNARSRKIYSSLLELVSLRVHHPSSYAEIQLDWRKVTGLGKILHSGVVAGQPGAAKGAGGGGTRRPTRKEEL